MTYEFLAKYILTQLTEEQKQQDVTVGMELVVGEEFFPIQGFRVEEYDDVLDKGHFVLEI